MADPFGPSRISRVDRSGVYSSYEEWPAQAKRGYAVRVDVPERAPGRGIVLGMGGSASAGDIISGWLTSREGTDVSVMKGSVPKSDMRGSLAIACSASGGTLETIQMMEAAKRQGATVVAISSGGVLMEKAFAEGIPHIEAPKAKAPRYMLPFMLFACLKVIVSAFGITADAEVSEAQEVMADTWESVRAEVPLSRNPAKKAASAMGGSVPKAYGTRLTRGVGVRFCNAVNENAKANAFFEEVPEAMHNDVETWEAPDRRFTPVILRCSGDDATVSARLGWFASAIARKGADVLEVGGEGRAPLAQLVSMAYKLDMASYYLAISRGVDPLPTKLLTSLRRRLGST